MTRRQHNAIVLVAIVSLNVVASLRCSSLLADETSVGIPKSPTIQFNRDVRPILSDNCYYCHGNDPKHRMADLRLDVREDAVAGGAIVPGETEDSLLVDRILSDDPDMMMPPPDSNKSLTAEQKEILKRWIAEGAQYEPHWSFAPPTMPSIPEDTNLHPIDYFIRQELRERGLEPSEPAELHTLIRRVHLDLIGLPPTPEEVDAFEAAAKQDLETAYKELIERLLSSPHYGERWGRWWLDQARYADSNGYSIDAPREIWKYRDWVIKAFNDDMPFDQFTIEQLAGDLLPDATINQKVATGFHRNTQINEEGGIDREQFRIDSVFDRVATTGTVWLGLTVGCAQCHDHKFDPIEQKEFYQLFAFLNNQDEPRMKVYEPDVDVEQLAKSLKDCESSINLLVKEHAEQIAQWESMLDDKAKEGLSKDVAKALAVEPAKRNASHQETLFVAAVGDNASYQALKDQRRDLDKQLNQVPTTLVLAERSKPRETHVFINGDFTRPAEQVSPGTLAVLHPFEALDSERLPNRLDLAKWIIDRQNPLTARVIVNRIWQQYFGRGIVETENDFGLQGSPPSHPQLLDWLALNFVDHKWSIKDMHRLIVTSETYRQSSVATEKLLERDPNNYLLARQTRLRLDAEIVRDVALTASGLLAPKLGGPSVFPPIPDGVMGQGQVKRNWTASTGENRYRRALYTFVYRGSPPPTLSVFDAPEGLSTCTRRIRSNTPLQSLTLMNDLGFFEFAESLQKIIERDGLEVAFRRCTSRLPSTDELAVLKKLDTLNAARVLLNLDETVTRE